MQFAQKCLPTWKLIKKYIDHFFLFLYKETQLRQRGRKGIPLAASFFLSNRRWSRALVYAQYSV